MPLYSKENLRFITFKVGRLPTLYFRTEDKTTAGRLRQKHDGGAAILTWRQSIHYEVFSSIPGACETLRKHIKAQCQDGALGFVPGPKEYNAALKAEGQGVYRNGYDMAREGDEHMEYATNFDMEGWLDESDDYDQTAYDKDKKKLITHPSGGTVKLLDPNKVAAIDKKLTAVLTWFNSQNKAVPINGDFNGKVKLGKGKNVPNESAIQVADLCS